MNNVNSILIPRAPEPPKRESKRAPETNTNRESVLSLMVLGNEQTGILFYYLYFLKRAPKALAFYFN